MRFNVRGEFFFENRDCIDLESIASRIIFEGSLN
jgi:hypothetical protein